MSPAQKRMRKPAPAPAKSNIPRRTHSAGKQSSLSFYLRDSAEGFPFPAVRLTPSVPVSGLLQSRVYPWHSAPRGTHRPPEAKDCVRPSAEAGSGTGNAGMFSCRYEIR